MSILVIFNRLFTLIFSKRTHEQLLFVTGHVCMKKKGEEGNGEIMGSTT